MVKVSKKEQRFEIRQIFMTRSTFSEKTEALYNLGNSEEFELTTGQELVDLFNTLMAIKKSKYTLTEQINRKIKIAE